ncbi:MAG TPA: hypothetical protein VLK89_08725 [Solirubrobacterales bacterium]|nr:hypothetical protein [Solirubrobacterales bacterium]
MSRGTKLKAGLTTLAVVTMAAALVAVPAGATKIVNVSSTLTISQYAYKGKVSAANPACIAERAVVLKQQGHGVLGRAQSTETGKWEVNPEDLHFKGQLPYKIYAELKPKSEGTAGTIYKCGGATSKTITINGG